MNRKYQEKIIPIFLSLVWTCRVPLWYFWSLRERRAAPGRSGGGPYGLRRAQFRFKHKHAGKYKHALPQQIPTWQYTLISNSLFTVSVIVCACDDANKWVHLDLNVSEARTRKTSQQPGAGEDIEIIGWETGINPVKILVAPHHTRYIHFNGAIHIQWH